MTELFLIAHSVRGEAAFDVATKMECPHCPGYLENQGFGCFDCEDLGYWWIIPTSGHRAFPYWHAEIIDNGIDIGLEWTDRPASPPPMPFGWPDHYKTGPAPKLDIKALFQANREPKPRIPRRL